MRVKNKINKCDNPFRNLHAAEKNMNQLLNNLSDVDRQVEFLREQLSASVKQVKSFKN